MKRILRNADLEVGKNYIVRAKTNNIYPNYVPIVEVTIVKELSGMKVIFDRLWATDDNNQALDRYEIYGPVDLEELIIPLQMEDVINRSEQFLMTKKRFSEVFEVFQKQVEYVGDESYYDIMVLQENDVWTQNHVIGKSLTGYLIFSGWFISECLGVKDYMTLDEFNEIEPHNHQYGTTMVTMPVQQSDIENIES